MLYRATILRSHWPQRSGTGLLVVLLVIAGHLLFFALLDRSRTPGFNESKRASLPLAVWLIQPKTSPLVTRPVASTRNVSKYTVVHQKSLKHVAPAIRDDLGLREAVPAAVVDVARPSVAPGPDWQSDLSGIVTGKSHRYGRVYQGMPASEEGAVSPTATSEATFSQGVSKAVRADCRDAHARAGLLAIPMILADMANRTGCKW